MNIKYGIIYQAQFEINLHKMGINENETKFQYEVQQQNISL